MRMSHGSIETRRHQNNIRVKTMGNGQDHGSKGCQVFRIGHWAGQPTSPGNVDVEAQTGGVSTFHWATSARVEVSIVVSVNADVEYAGVFVKRLLCLKQGYWSLVRSRD